MSHPPKFPARPVLILGCPRSGTTWTGEVLSMSAKFWYLFEPDQPRYASPYCARLHEYWTWPQWYVGGDEENIELFKRADLMRRHLSYLIRHRKPRGKVPLIKMPRVEKMPPILKALRPRAVVYLERNPLGILNSHLKHDLLHVHRDYLRNDYSQLVRQQHELEVDVDLAEAQSLEEQLLLSMHVRNRLARRILAQYPHRIVSYENLCRDVTGGFADLFQFIQAPFTPAIRRYMEAMSRPAQEENHLHSVHQPSRRRAYGWLNELPEALLDRLHALVDQAGLPRSYFDSHLQGGENSSPPLSSLS